jgi:hypothetical protein
METLIIIFVAFLLTVIGAILVIELIKKYDN